MNSIFKELLDSGRIDPNPIFECTSDGVTRKAYKFADGHVMMSQSRFEDIGEVMKAYSAFDLEYDDVSLYFGIVKNNLKRAMSDYRHDADSAIELMQQVLKYTDEIEARREFKVPLAQSFDLLSFGAIEEDENPLVYNHAYNKEKVKRWKKDLDVEKKRIFLIEMLPRFPIFSPLLELGSLKSLTVQAMLENTSLQILWHGRGMSGLSPEIVGILESQMEKSKLEIDYLTELSRITTDT